MPEAFPDTAEPVPLLIPVRTVAKILGISPRTVWRLLSAGKIIPPVRVGGAVRWKSDALKMWVEEGCPQPTKPQRKPR